MNPIEMDIVRALLGILSVAITSAVSYFSMKLKRSIDAHLSHKQARMFNDVVDGLSQIADMTVSDFNQRVVLDAKNQGLFTSALAKSIKQDALAAVKQQGSSLIQLAGTSITDVDQLVSTLIEQSVLKQKKQSSTQSTSPGTTSSVAS